MLLRRDSRRRVLAALLALGCACLLASGCDQLKKLIGGNAPADDPVPEALYPLHTALEAGAKDDQKSTVAVLAVVDQSRFTPAPAAGGDQAAGGAAAGASGSPAAAPADDTDALRLERLARQALNNGFIHNKLLDVVQPDDALMQQARDEVVKNNSAALSTQTVKDLGAKLKVMFIVNAVIENGGAEVNVAGQRVDDGSLIFQDSVKNWSIFAAPTEGAATQ
jgi:hypothetical protein